MTDRPGSATAASDEFGAAPAQPKRRRRGLWRRFWRYLLAVVGLLILAHLVLNIIAGRRLEAELSRIRAAGQPLTLAEAAPPKVPDAQNAALLYQQAFNGLSKPEAHGEIAAAFYGLGTHEKSRPALAEVEAVLARHEADFRLLEEGSRRPACRFPVNWEAGLAATCPHLARVRLATRFLVAKALAEAERGRSGEALNDLGIVVRLTNHISAEPTVIAQLMRVVCIAMMFYSTPEILAAAPPSEMDSRALYDLLGTADTISHFVRAVEGERADQIQTFEQIRRAGPILLLSLPNPEVYPSSWVRRLARAWPVLHPFWEPFLKLDEVACLRFLREGIALARKPYAQSQAGLRRIEQEHQNSPWYAVLSPPLARALTPVSSRGLHLREHQALAMTRLLRGALALRAYQIEHGDYPASLGELRARGGWAIPDDPFPGKPFIYRREGKGYLLYSVGPDETDNGGLTESAAWLKAWQKGVHPTPEQYQYDIPLRMTR